MFLCYWIDVEAWKCTLRFGAFGIADYALYLEPKWALPTETTVDISSLPEPAIRLEDTALCGSYQTLEFAILEQSFWIGQERALTKDNLKHLKHSLQSGVSFCSERTHRVSASNRNGTETSASAVISMEWPSGRWWSGMWTSWLHQNFQPFFTIQHWNDSSWIVLPHPPKC